MSHEELVVPQYLHVVYFIAIVGLEVDLGLSLQVRYKHLPDNDKDVNRPG